MGHASPSTTLNTYAHMFDEARHVADIRTRMARSAFAGLLDAGDADKRRVITLPRGCGVTRGPGFGSSASRVKVSYLTKA
jgi:hypothetical protein